MAKILGKDPVTYTKERDGFLRDLQHFHESRGTPFRRAPILSGREIDLYLLYSLVTAQGGWIKVNSKNAWTELFEYFRVPGKCVNGSIALKQIYLRYLDRWEKVHYLGEEADRGSDDDEESRHKRWSARALHSVPLTYNYTQHNIAESTREYNHLSTDLYKCSDYDRLALSLLSPLPNEQDFAINVCTLLSNDGKHTLKIEKHPRLIDYLIAHAGVFNHHSLRNVFIESYSKIRGYPLHTFWKDVVHSEEYLDLTDERKYMPEKDPKLTEKGTKAEEPSQPITSEINTGVINVEVLKESPITKSPEPMIVDSEPVNVDSDSELFASDDVEATTSLNPSYIVKLKPHSSDKDIFCLGRSLGTRDYVGQRVLQVATILRNLTFIEENVPILTKNRTFIRFMLLCVCSRWNQLQNLGMDMLGNVATEFLVKDPQTDKLTFFLIKLVSNGLLSEDRNSCISSLDALNKLSQNEANEDSLSRCLESFVYTRVCSFLTIHDVMLLIYTLECLYSLSSLGERPCNFIVGNHGVVDTLVSLVTVEGKSYGPKACIGMKLVETVPGGNANSSANNSNSSTTTSSTSTTVASSSASSTSTTTSTVTTLQSASKVSTSQSNTPQRMVQVAPQRLIAITPVSSPAATPTPITSTQTPTPSISPQQLVQQQHAHQQAIQENEQFALAWLRATYEPCSTGRVDHQELYKHYINSCAKIGRRGVIAPLHFPRCVRSVFGGTVGPNPVKPVTSNDPQFYDGIKARAQQLVINMQPVTTPVAQATPKTVRRKAQNVTVVPVSTPTTPTLTVVADNTDTPPASPASPILKAQLSAPPKPRESTVVTAISKSDIKSQVMAHPHLSQALLGSAATTAVTQASTSKDAVAGQSNTSLIKSLLATKVNECMTSVSMRTATDCQIVTTQVAARQQQQRLLAQQTTPMQTPDSKSSTKLFDTTPKSSRINGARQLFSETDTTDSDVSSTTQNNSNKNRREPPQPPPPLAPLSGNLKGKVLRIENEDSDSTGNNSLASSTGLGHVGLGGVSSTEDGDNSLTSFEGLLNGIPSLDNPLNDDSNSKDSLKSSIKKPLMLADLLEKKIEKDPMLNGVLGKELRLGEKGLDLVENHIEKVLSKENNMNESSMIDATGTNNLDKNNDVNKQTLKRSASEELTEPDAKKIHLSNVNGNADSPAPESVSSSNGDEQPTEKVSTAAAKLFADMAADILEDEDEEELMQEAVGHQQQAPQTVVEDTNVVQIASNTAGVSQMFVDGNQQVLLQPRQIIVSQPQLQAANQMVIPAGTQLKTQGGQTVIVQNSTQQRTPVVLQQANAGQILLSQGLQSIQGQVQLVASSSQPGQYVIQTGGPQSAYVVAQSQTAMVHGQPQTVLVAQTPQQQGTGTKTIIILQQQPTPSATATHHQKVVVTPQGQQVVVTQVQRPILQTSTVSNNPPPTSTVIKSVGSTTTTQVTPVSTSSNTITVIEKKIDDVKSQPRMKINRDMSTPFVCEWGDCQVDIKFTSANQVYLHVCEEHVPKGSEEIVCQWERCDNMKRKRFSLMTHLNDKHCNTEAMRASLTRRRQMSHAGKVESPVTNTATPHPGYAPDAAFHAIKRHALEFVNPKELQRSSKQGTTVSSTATPPPRPGPPATEQDDNEGPVTKSIRLTASLILRNLVIYSSNCRRYLKHYEPHLANVALSNVESSRTIAQVLYDMNEGASHR